MSRRAWRQIRAAPKAIFFDAAGTLFHLPKGVGYHYALVGKIDWPVARRSGARPRFRSCLERNAGSARRSKVPREEDDKGWWRELVEQVIDRVAPETKDLDRDAFFEVAYEHFAEAGVWELYPEVADVLETLRPRFRARARFKLRRTPAHDPGATRHLAILLRGCHFQRTRRGQTGSVIFQRALEMTGVTATEAFHVGDDPVQDWQGAAAAGLSLFQARSSAQFVARLASAACAPLECD